MLILNGRSQENRASLFSVVPGNRTRGNGRKLEPRKFHLNLERNFFPLGLLKPWTRLSAVVVELSSLDLPEHFNPFSNGVGLDDP